MQLGVRGLAQMESKAAQSGLSSVGQEALSSLLSAFPSYSSWFFSGGTLEPKAPASLLAVLCITNMFTGRLGTTFHLVLPPPLLCSPAQKGITTDDDTPAYTHRQSASILAT